MKARAVDSDLLEIVKRYLPEQSFFEDVVDYDQWVQEAFPLLKWDKDLSPPDYLNVVLMALPRSPTNWEDLLLDLLRHSLVPDRKVSIRAFQHSYMAPTPVSSRLIFVGHAQVLLQDDYEWRSARACLETWATEISTNPSRFLLSTKSGLRSDENAIRSTVHKYRSRFPSLFESGVEEDVAIFFDLIKNEYLKHRTTKHVIQLVLSLYWMRRQILRSMTQSTDARQLKLRLIPGKLHFPFSRKKVLGCLIAAYWQDRFELLDEEYIFQALQKLLPTAEIIRDSIYFHSTKHEKIKMLYFEIEKKGEEVFSARDRRLLLQDLQDRLQQGFPKLYPSVFMRRNEEEIYKNILTLSQQLQSPFDLPQVIISFESQAQEDVSFLVILVTVSTKDILSIENYFGKLAESFVFEHERTQIVRYLEERYPVQAHLFRLRIPRDFSLLRSDGSLNFYLARQKVAALIEQAIGEFRDFNGGLLVKQSELLFAFRERFKELTESETELLEDFFYAITPLEKQATLSLDVLSRLFQLFLDGIKKAWGKEASYFFNVQADERHTYLAVRVKEKGLLEQIVGLFNKFQLRNLDITTIPLESRHGYTFSCLIQHAHQPETEALLHEVRNILHRWRRKVEEQQVLRIAFQHVILSLDPRIGGDGISASVVRLLFEGLMRINANGEIEKGVAKSFDISPDGKRYLFELRSVRWNDGTPIVAYDFEYAWKKVLSPDFKTSFAYLFYPIKNAKKAKEGLISIEEVGIRAVDEKTLLVELAFPAPYFLDLVAHPMYSPVNHRVDQRHPGWPYQVKKQYPCNGPFEIEIHHPQQGYKFVKNPFYWDASNIALDQIVLMKGTTDEAIEMLHKNELDWVGSPLGYLGSQVAAAADEKVMEWPDGGVLWAALNNHRFPFNNLKIRKAMAMALDRSALSSAVASTIKPADSVFPLHHRLTSCSIPTDRALAKQLFEEGLKECNLELSQFPPITITYAEGRMTNKHVANVLKKQWEETFNIQCRLDNVVWGVLFQKAMRRECDIILTLWLSWFDDPIYTLNAFRFASEDSNFSNWEHPDYQELLAKADKEVDSVQRKAYLAEAEKFIIDQVPVVPLFYSSYQSLMKKGIKIIYRLVDGTFHFARTVKEK
ncbi:MAG: peptide ABC transporter substrate-binding protein [Verrucomicrobia bacterium]|nr:peptide ABC transporter substrate-binding protein [Verrucomicrobiota bacterium]